MKKVFQIVSNPWTSGLEKVVMNICTLVPGYDFTYVVPHGPIEQDLRDRNIKYLAVDNLNSLSIREIIKKYRPDIIHGHDVKASIYMAFNYLFCKKNGIKIISELHNDDVRMHKFSIRSITYLISTFAYDKIVVVSDEALENYIFKKFIFSKSQVIKNVINPNIIHKTNDYVNSFDFLFLGRLEYQKNPEKFVEFIRKIKKNNPRVSALMIGKGSLKNSLKKIILKYRLQNNIKLIGYKSNPYPYMNKCKAVVITSRYEGICLVALESLVLGKPIITVNVDGVSQLINDSCGIKSNNVDTLVDYGNKLIKEKDFLSETSKNAYKQSKVVNDVNKFIESYSKLYIDFK